MNTQQQVEKRVEEAMNSLDGIQRATANPFMFTRIAERMRQRNSPWEKAASFIARPVFAMAMVILFLAANFYVATKEKEERMALQKQTNEQVFAAEFYISSNLTNESSNLNR